MATQKHKIFSVGITTTPERLAKLEANQKRSQEAGYDHEMYIFPVDEHEAALEHVKGKLASKKYDGLIVGFGLRGDAKNTILFEKIVNLASEMVPGIKFGFSGSPDDLFDCVVRNYGGA